MSSLDASIEKMLVDRGMHAGEALAIQNQQPISPFEVITGNAEHLKNLALWDDAFLNVVLYANALATVRGREGYFIKNSWVPHAQKLIRPYDDSLAKSKTFVTEDREAHFASFDAMAERVSDKRVGCSTLNHAKAVALGHIVLLKPAADEIAA